MKDLKRFAIEAKDGSVGQFGHLMSSPSRSRK
jgi:hypothetical protein